MAKQLNVSFGFKADTSQARSSIQGLITDLNKLGSLNSTTNLNITPQLTEAKMAAMQLGQQLNAALNVDTGKLDLNKLNTSLRKSGMSLQDYGAKLSALGPQGQQAFSQVARSIVETEAPLRRSSGLLKEFGTTIANTARWQISSSILHGFMGALQQATGYAKALDKSLNDIRIVTDYGSNEMAKFAKQANIAAKALSTTTTEYTNASLIYFQQGLSAEEVKERTEVTIKMANAAGQSAEVVSDQMTAVWNNFADGTKSLEYYADVMTALGAATASSTDEIAGGLEKFAAIGETIGLSYEYAASALATITSNTRQSEEVVGTALKTIFARIQGLELGETLEDGVDLNKYSKALESVGINILDVSGEMKDMDVILDEMAEKWNKLSGAQQAALAQTVAGVRQYTQLIALMENWNDGSEDSMMANLSTSYGATGTLDKQAETYAESWEASKDRVTAALEGVYDSILDENLFIGINDTLVDVIGMVEKMIDAMGGLPGILSVAGILLTSIFKDDIANGINNALHNFKNFTGASKAELDTLKQKAYEYTKSLSGGISDPQTAAENTYTERTYEMQKQLEQALKGTNAAQEEAIRETHQIAQNYAEAALNAQKMAIETENAQKAATKQAQKTKGIDLAFDMDEMLDTANFSAGEELINISKQMEERAMAAGGAGEEVSVLKAARTNYANVSKDYYSLPEDQRGEGTAAYAALQEAAERLQSAMKSLHTTVASNAEIFDSYKENLIEVGQKVGEVEVNITSMQQALREGTTIKADSAEGEQIQKSIKDAKDLGLPVTEEASSALDEFTELKAKGTGSAEELDAAWQKVLETFKQITISAEDAEKAMEKMAKEKTAASLAKQDTEVEKLGEAYERAQQEADDAQARVPSKASSTGKERSRKQAAADQKHAEASQAKVKYEEAAQRATERTSKVLTKVTKNTGEYTKVIHDNAKAQRSATVIDENAAKKKDELVKAMTAAKKSAQDFGQGATTALSGTSQLSMGIFSLKSALDALKDPDLSSFEKFTQVLMSTSMGLPSLVNGFSMVKKGISEMIGAMGGSTTALLANALGLDANALAESKLNEEVLKGLGLTTTKTSLTTAEQMSLIKTVALKTLEAEAAEESNEEKAKEAGLTMANVATRLMENMALKGGISGRIASTAATIGQTLANWGLNASMVPVLAITLAITAAMLAAVAVIGAVVGAIYLIVQAYNADAQAAKDAQAQVESLTETYEECKSAAEELKATISNWEGGIEALKELDASTDEYRAKLEEVNAQARELIETYGLYDGFEVKGGVITFKEGVLEDLQNTKDEKVNDTEDQLNAAKIIANNARIKSEGTDLGRQQGYLVDKTMYNPDTGGYVSRQATSSEMQSFAKVLDGIAAEKSKNLPEGEEFELSVEDVRAALEAGVDGLPQIIQDNLSSISDEDIAAVINFRDSINEAAAANKYYAEQVMGNQVENQFKGLYESYATDWQGNTNQALVESMLNAGTAYASENVTVDGKTMDQALNDIDVSKATSNSNMSNYGYDIENDKDLAKTYATEVLGWSEEDFSYQSGTGKGTLTNATSGQEMTLDDNVMRQALARQSQVDDITSEFEAATQEKMDAFNTAMGNTVKGAKNDTVATTILDAAGSDTKEIDYSELVHQISPSELIDMSEGGMTSDEIMTTLGLSHDDLKALGLDNGQAFTDGLQEALLTYNPEEFYKNMQEQASAAAGNMAKAEGFSEEDTKDIQEYAKHLIDVAEESEVLSDNLDENAEAAAQVATYTSKMNRGIDTLANGFEDWNSILKKSDKSSAEYSKALSGMKGALSDILGVEEEYISNDFVTDHMDDIKLAAEGNADAIDRLAIAAGKDIIVNMEIEGGEEVKEQVLALHDQLAAEIPDIKVGATVDDADFMAKAAQIVEQAGMSVEQANAYFRSMGFEPKFETKQVPVTREVKAIETTTQILEWGEAPGVLGGLNKFPTKIRESSQEVSTGTVTEMMEVPALTTDGGEPNFTLTRTNAGAMNNYSSTNSGGVTTPGGGTSKGGGGSDKEPEKAKRIEKDDTIERYKEIEDQLDDVRDASDEAAKAADRMYGAGKIAQMAKANALLIKEVKLLKEKKKEAEAYLRMDKNKLNQAARAAGISFTYDEKGNVTNYAEQYNKMVDDYDKMADEYDAKGTAATEEDKQKLEEAEQKIRDVEDAMSQYTDTRELIEDIDTEVTDKFYQWQDNNAEMWNYALDIAINFNEDALELLDFWLKTIEEDFYRAAEGAAVLGAEILACNASAGTYVAGLAALGAQMATGSISSEAFAEGLEKVKSGLQQTAEKIRELDDKMLHYYGDTLDKGREEIDKVTDQLEHQSSVLEHYNTLLDLMGKSTDYEAKGKVLAGQVETAKNEMIAAREEADLFARQAEDRYIDYQGSIFRTSTEMRKQQYEDALQASMETQEEYLSKAEAYAEALNATLENSLAMYGQQLENALTGGTSFDQMTVQMDRMVSLQEEYLTTTNKIYETEKLMNQAQQHIDKTTNTVAKQKLKNFINETNQLQEKTKLSQYELDIQTAKYELLLAEIALEEAQASKSQVRLQRDAEGNFGYVYTSDATQVAEAEQNYADKQNELYNLSLEGINNYAEKYQQTLQEMYEELTDIDQQYREGAFESEEEYHAARLAAQEYYFQKLEEYQDLYTIATETDANAQQDAWGSSYSEMINSTEEWKTEVIKHSELVSDSFDTWKGEMETLAEDLGLDYQTLADSVGSVTTKSNELTEELVKDGGLIDQVETQIDLVAILTNVYASLRWAVLGLAAAYSILAAALTAVAAIQAVVGIDFSGVMSLFNVLSGGAATFLSAGSGGGIITSLATAAAGLLTGFDTGGYTGEWGPYGKMAMLHEKELVLNAGDTENFLAGMKVLDNITQTIDLHSANQQLGGGMMTSPMMGEIGSDALEQSVTIEANFPNVSSRTEIEEAFTTLVNRASQYANRK